MIDLKKQTLNLIRAGKEITSKWDCGGDEAHVLLYLDGELMDYKDQYVEKIYIYLINYLNLPDAGEFVMEGKGRFVEEEGEVYIEYESTMKGYEGWDPKTSKSTGWQEVNEKVEEHSGKKNLFEEK